MTSIRNFQRTETIIIEAEVYDDGGDLVDPATSMHITITDPAGTRVIPVAAPPATQSMVNDSVGMYHYDYTPGAAAILGWYRVHIVATDSTRVSISDGGFTLES